MNRLFTSINAANNLPASNAVNEAGGSAYYIGDEQVLASLCLTGTFNGTYYSSAEAQLDKIHSLAKKVSPEFLAKLAIYCRRNGFMKDTPAFLLAVLATRDINLFTRAFSQVVDNVKMARNFVQVIRSGVVGRKSLGTRPKRELAKFLENLTPVSIFRQSTGNTPSLADLVKLVHPKPSNESRKAFYGWLLGKEHNESLLPEIVREFESYKSHPIGTPPDVPFEMLTALNLGEKEWSIIAENATWTQTRMNLNTFQRHGVFNNAALTKKIAARLSNEEEVRRSRCFPYQLLIAYTNTDNVPTEIRIALQKAMEVAIENVPEIDGQIYVFPDVSGSMLSPVTGHRPGSTTKVRCIDIAALVAASFMRKNPTTVVLPFDTRVHTPNLNPLDSVVTNAQKLAAYGGGGTACSLPLQHLNSTGAKGDLCIYVSDNESWVDSGRPRGWYDQAATGTMQEWNKFSARNRNAKLVCIDIQPYATSQTAERKNILQVAGFSDNVYTVIRDFVGNEKITLVDRVNGVVL